MLILQLVPPDGVDLLVAPLSLVHRLGEPQLGAVGRTRSHTMFLQQVAIIAGIRLGLLPFVSW